MHFVERFSDFHYAIAQRPFAYQDRADHLQPRPEQQDLARLEPDLQHADADDAEVLTATAAAHVTALQEAALDLAGMKNQLAAPRELVPEGAAMRELQHPTATEAQMARGVLGGQQPGLRATFWYTLNAHGLDGSTRLSS